MVKTTPSLYWLWRLHRGKLLGAAAGLLVALLIRWVGLVWALVILVLMIAGAAMGGYLVDSRAELDIDVVDE